MSDDVHLELQHNSVCNIQRNSFQVTAGCESQDGLARLWSYRLHRNITSPASFPTMYYNENVPKLPFPIDLLRRSYNSVRTAVRHCERWRAIIYCPLLTKREETDRWKCRGPMIHTILTPSVKVPSMFHWTEKPSFRE